MNRSDDDCPGFNDLLWFVVCKVQHSPEERVDIETHIKLCDKCKKGIATMNRWAEEDAEACRRIDALPFSTLKERFEKALAEDNAAEMTVIVERLGQIAALCVRLLKTAARKAPGVARPHAEKFLRDMQKSINDIFPHHCGVEGDDWD